MMFFLTFLGIGCLLSLHKRNAARTASKAARKLARGPLHAVVGGLVLLSAVLGGAWMLWGIQGAIWAAWFMAGPFVVGPAMLALRRWFHRFLGVD